jgi:hypothetical protein
MSRTFLTVGEELYEVLKIYNEGSVPDVELWKSWWGAEKVFRKEGKLFLTGLNADIMEVFQITKLEKFFNFQSNIECALDSI